MKKIAVFISGTGSNMISIVNAAESGLIEGAEIALVLASKPSAKGLDFARNKGIKTAVFVYGDKNDSEIAKGLSELMERNSIDFIALAGYVKVLPKDFTDKYKGKIVNIHPSLIPLFCGKGFYGLKVHQAVLDSGMKVTGATVHFVDSGVDTGKIIEQDTCRVFNDDTAEILQKRVLEIEHRIFPLAISNLIR